MNFDDIKLHIGYPLQLQLAGEGGRSPRYPCRLLGAISGKYLLVSLPRTRKGALRLRNGQRLGIRLMVDDGIIFFSTSIESQVSTPHPIVYLDYPKRVKFTQIRAATRVDVNHPVTVVNLASLDNTQSSGRLVDVSIKGARLALDSAIGEVGDRLEISGRVPIGSLLRPLAVTGVIRSRLERSTRELEDEQPAVYGVEFTETDEEQLLVLYAYVYAEIAAGFKVSVQP